MRCFSLLLKRMERKGGANEDIRECPDRKGKQSGNRVLLEWVASDSQGESGEAGRYPAKHGAVSCF